MIRRKTGLSKQVSKVSKKSKVNVDLYSALEVVTTLTSLLYLLDGAGWND